MDKESIDQQRLQAAAVNAFKEAAKAMHLDPLKLAENMQSGELSKALVLLDALITLMPHEIVNLPYIEQGIKLLNKVKNESG